MVRTEDVRKENRQRTENEDGGRAVPEENKNR